MFVKVDLSFRENGAQNHGKFVHGVKRYVVKICSHLKNYSKKYHKIAQPLSCFN